MESCEMSNLLIVTEVLGACSISSLSPLEYVKNIKVGRLLMMMFKINYHYYLFFKKIESIMLANFFHSQGKPQ